MDDHAGDDVDGGHADDDGDDDDDDEDKDNVHKGKVSMMSILRMIMIMV